MRQISQSRALRDGVDILLTCPSRHTKSHITNTSQACPKGRTTTNEPPPQKPKEKPPPAVKPNPNFKCPCEEVYCIQSYPESCECENRNKRECFDNCGGLEPTYDVSVDAFVLLFVQSSRAQRL
ncbi:uncharacterized protein BKA78DRAFT_309992 [Phyllosticta capitalensis]|uniref:uncharacterized protein n=1 Tax=Phyllosticta capitalensis TaxID=121624 RepID=UPI00312CCD75